MSEHFTSRVEAYAAPQQADIARRAGLADDVVGALAAGAAALAVAAVGAVAAMVEALREQARKEATQLRALAGQSVGHGRLAQELASSRALLGALERPEFFLLRAAAERDTPAGVAKLAQRLSSLEVRSRSRRSDIPALAAESANAKRELDRAVQEGVGRLLRAEASLLHDAAAATLSDMGYEISRPKQTTGSRVVLRGSSETGTGVYVQIDPGRGQLSADFSGFQGTACVKERDRFLQGLADRGIRVRLLARDLHGRPEGGTLARDLAPHFAGVNDQEQDRQRRAALARRLRTPGGS